MTNVIKKIYKNGTEYDIYATGGAEGAVSGPSSATDGHLAVFDGTSGKAIKDGGAVPSYTSKPAASGGTDLSLVTTGEKYTWNNKQNALTTQTAYTSKGTATKVPTITTNTLGQVTAISETNISFPVTSVNGSTGAVTGLQPEHTTLSLTLTTAGWSSNTQTVTATGVTASNTVIISPAPASFDDYTGAVIKCSAQASNSLTFTCGTVPTSAITVNVVIFN